MTQVQPSLCKCGAAILWVRSEGGRLMPVDAKPKSFPGHFRVELGQAVPLVGHETHFATCPMADKFRRKP